MITNDKFYMYVCKIYITTYWYCSFRFRGFISMPRVNKLDELVGDSLLPSHLVNIDINVPYRQSHIYEDPNAPSVLILPWLRFRSSKSQSQYLDMYVLCLLDEYIVYGVQVYHTTSALHAQVDASCYIILWEYATLSCI